MSPDYELKTFADAPASVAPTNAAAGRANFRTSVINLDRPGDPSVFGEKTRAEAAELISRYPEGQARSALLPLLHLVQSEQGYVTPDGIAFCADTLGITKAQVAAVATFYTMYKRSPTGEYLVSVCTNTLCGMLGGDEIFGALKDQLGVGNNQTTPDGRITLEHAECLAACDYAPVVTVNYEFFDNQTVGSARNIVSQLQSGDRPLPTRGAPLCSFKQIERQIAGFHDEAALASEANGSGVPTEAGVKLAIERGDTAPSYAVDRTGGATEPKAAETAPAPAKKAARKRTAKPAADAPSSPATSEGPSEHDAPLETAESDSAHPSDPAGKKDD
ncbi:MAG TPA: NADH-quinone oxidoreductase subunit NuoE [Jatrophihabitans sp.]|jgi:NADH-quinone oxidoreductase subunit E|uniref:NADH-quinone oxidoreductase subunit NuoE n=1 Tax=Jatrophihabitans sp. TaxID=1932789 RepID=UPI002E014C9A|nr:NADH-quinone oxidoreductase subunit NuoE [Jatrophihabitans sp.]